MLSNKSVLSALRNEGVNFYCGVPDSLLKDFCAFLTDQTTDKEHVIAANEGGAVALACGYHIATGEVPMVYLQNSGLGNTVNPILSLADQEVYSIPMLVMIGWRGEPGVHDEPQHVKQGRVQNDLLEAMEIPYKIIDQNTTDINGTIKNLTELAKKENQPVALVIRKGTFEPYKLQKKDVFEYPLSREEAIKIILSELGTEDVIVSTTGKPSREVFEFRAESKFGHQNDFLTVGSMGHCSQIAMGIALKTERNVYCLDGDGAVIMHMGNMSITGQSGLKNFKHIVLNNGAHDSVGGQPTVGFNISISDIAKANGYKEVFQAKNEDDLKDVIQKFIETDGPVFLEVLINKGARKDLGRPTTTPKENKEALMMLLDSK